MVAYEMAPADASSPRRTQEAANASQVADLSLADGKLFHNRKGKALEWPQPLAPLADTHGHLTAFWGTTRPWPSRVRRLRACACS